MLGCGEGDEESDRCEAGVDGVREALRAQGRVRRAETLFADPGDGRVERELRRQRTDVDRPRRPARHPVARRRGEREHDGRPERVPGADETQRRARQRHLPETARIAQQVAGRDAERDPGQGQHEQHRHEHELDRDRVADARLEAHAREQPVQHRVEHDREHTGVPRRVRE